MANFVFYYFGDDEAYFRTLSAEFAKHSRMSIAFKRFFETDEKKIQSLFLKVFQNKPSCVFIDFSKHTQDYLHLARIISRSSMEHELVTVGLVDFLSPPEVLAESIATGVDLNHIKSAESFDVVFDVSKLVSTNDTGEHGFAKASLKDEYEAGITAKVGYIHAEGMHIETDIHVQKGDRLRINHHWTQKKIVPSREVFVSDVSQKNLFYHFKYAVDVDFLFIDEFIPAEGMEAEIIEQKKVEREHTIQQYKKLLSRWINDNVTVSLEKKAKVLVVDREFHFYNDQARTDKHAYTIRCVPYLDETGNEIDRLEPQVIAFSIDKESPEAKNTIEKLSGLINLIKTKGEETGPFVIVFSCSTTSKELQESLGYPHIMTTPADLSVDVLVRMAEIFNKRLSKSLPAMTKVTKVPQKVFLKKTNAASIAEIVFPITIIKLSETDLIFQTDRELPIGMNIHLTSPVDMFVNVQPSKGQSKIPEYYGLIHALGEVQKKDLRKFVNSVFFRDHDAKVHSEAEEFKKLNETKLHEKQESDKTTTGESEENSDCPSPSKEITPS
jgi:hypothetical protein